MSNKLTYKQTNTFKFPAMQSGHQDGENVLLSAHTGTSAFWDNAHDEIITIRAASNSANALTYAATARATLPTYTNDQIRDELIDTRVFDGKEFLEKWDVSTGGTLTYYNKNLNPNAQFLARKALDAWEAVTGLNFKAVSNQDDANWTFANSTGGGGMTTGSIGTVKEDGEVVGWNWRWAWISVNGKILNDSVEFAEKSGSHIFDTWGYETYVHEIGHALGLDHPGAYNGTGIHKPDGTGANHFLNDTTQASVMSYFSPSYVGATIVATATPMVADILAMQKLYGVATNLRTGDTYYGPNSASAGIYGDIIGDDSNGYNGNKLGFTIVDNGGIDTLDLNFSRDQKINLNAISRTSTVSANSDVFGYKGNMAIAPGTVIENAYGGSRKDTIEGNAVANILKGRAGNDELKGNAGDDILNGGIGADILNGGTGTDRVQYSDSTSALTVDLLYVNNNTGEAQGDLFYWIEDLQGTRYSDILSGNNSANSIWGDGGSDKLYGRYGNDILIGGSDADLLDGGSGNDQAGYSSSSSGVTADLQNSRYNTGDARGDQYVSIEGLSGSRYSDNLRGNAGSNEIHGLTGNDRIYARDGHDSLYGEDGNDRLFGQNGNDTIDGGEGNDQIYGGAGIDQLYGGAGNDSIRGHDGGDRIYGQDGDDRLYGYNHNDFLDGGAGNDRIFGGNYYDKLYGRDGNDSLFGQNHNDRLYGGNGNDRLYGGNGSDGLYGESGDDYLNGGTDNDSLFGQDGDDRLYGYNHNDFLDGGAGNDRIQGGNHNDRLYGRDGNDILLGQNHNDTLWGGNGNDRLYGGNGSDDLYGDGGDDYLNLGTGDTSAQHAFGGWGNDTYIIARGIGTANLGYEKAGGGSDTFWFTNMDLDDYNLSSSGTTLTFTAKSGTDRIYAHNADQIETFRFADRATYDYDDLFALA